MVVWGLETEAKMAMRRVEFIVTNPQRGPLEVKCRELLRLE